MKSKDYLLKLRGENLIKLQKTLEQEREKLARFRLDHSVGKLKDYKEIGKTRKKIAQILTVIKDKEIRE